MLLIAHCAVKAVEGNFNYNNFYLCSLQRMLRKLKMLEGRLGEESGEGKERIKVPMMKMMTARMKRTRTMLRRRTRTLGISRVTGRSAPSSGR